MSLTRAIAHNTLIQVIGKALGLSFSIVTLGLLTRYLGPTDFGYFTTIFALLQIFATLVDFGLQMSTVQMISDPRENETEMFNNIISFRLVSSGLCLAAGIIITQFLPYPGHIKSGVVIAGSALLATALFSIFTALFQKRLRMTTVAVADFVIKCSQFLFVAWAIYAKLNLSAMLWAVVASNLLGLIIMLFTASKLIRIRPIIRSQAWRLIVSRTWPIAVTILFNLVYFKADTIILSLFRPAEEVGLYGAPYKIFEVLINFSYLFLGLLMPFMTQAYATGNLEKLKGIIQKGFDAMLLIVVPMTVGTVLLGEKIMLAVAGPAYAVSGKILAILIIACACVFVAAVFGYAIVAMNEQKSVIKFYALNAVLSIIGYLALIPLFSYWAAAWVTVGSEIFILATGMFMIRKKIAWRGDYRLLGKIVLSSLIMAVATISLRALPVFVPIAGSVIVYGVALYFLGGITKATLLDVISLKTPHRE